jgi:hypothetical protein
MSYNDPATEQLSGPDSLSTAEQPAVTNLSAEPTAQHEADAAPAGQSPPQAEDAYLDDDDEWVSQAPKGWRVRGTTGILLLLLFAAAGFWGGSALQKHHDKSSGSTAAAAAASRFGALAGRSGTGTSTGGRTSGGAAGGAGTGGIGGGFARNGTVGIVTTIEGSTVYVTDSSGNLVKVTTNPSSTVTKTVSGTVGDLQPGQTVVVQGSKAADGSTTARSITIAPAGSSFGLGGRFGGGGGGGSGPTGGGG